MPPKRNTAHLHRANGRTACGRERGIFTPNVQHVQKFRYSLRSPNTKVCAYCRRAYYKLPPGSR